MGLMSIEVKIHYYEVVEAIELYIKENYNMDLDLDIYSENCVLAEGIVEVEYHEIEPVYKKHKNGKVVKSQHGHPVVDRENSKYAKKHVSFDEAASFVFSVDNKSGW
jgi:hypothetical protein